MADTQRYKWFAIGDFRGGRNATDDPLSIAETQVVQMRNGDTFRTALFRKRGGAAAPSIGSVFSAVLSSLIGHSPSNNPAAVELWGVDDAATPNIGRMAAASTFSAPTMKDNIASGGGPKVRGASYNGKLFLAFDTAVDFMHVFDPNLSSPAVRRVGLATPSAPTVADNGSGSYAAVDRYYRQRYRIKHGSIVDAQSEASAASSVFTPSGSGTGARVTKSASISESETHWVVEGSPDGVNYFELAEVAVGTTTYDDTAVPTSYSANNLSPVTGAYIRPTSWKYLIAAFNRVFGMGSHESGGLQSRIWYTPSKGTSDKADDERIPNTLIGVRNFFDIGEGQYGDGTGFAGPIYGSIYIFKYGAIRKATPTGAASPVFDVIDISNTEGAIDQECIALAKDAQNRPCIYFLDSQVGPMTVGPTSPMEIGQGVRDQWDLVNLAATNRVGWVLDYPAKMQVWFAWATGSNNDPNVLAIYNKRTGGWAVFDTGGKIRLARCAVLFARTLGATMSRDKVPYVGYVSANNTLLRGDTSDTSDDSTTFQATVKTRPIAFNNGKPFRTSVPIIVAKPASGVTLTVTADGDFGFITRSTTISLTPTADEASATRIFRPAVGLDLGGVSVVQYEIGDGSAVANAWQIEHVWVPVQPQDVGP